MTGRIEIEKAEGTWVVRAGGAVLGESNGALVLHEEGHSDVVYFPRGDIAMAFLDGSQKTTHCPLKGDATYYSIVTKSLTIKDAAWSYETPKDDAAQIAGHLAFHGEDVTIEQV